MISCCDAGVFPALTHSMPLSVSVHRGGCAERTLSAPVATALPMGVELAAQRLQLPSAVNRDNAELHSLGGRTVSRPADHCANPALPDIRSFVPASKRRSRHANTDSGNPRKLAMPLDSNRPH